MISIIGMFGFAFAAARSARGALHHPRGGLLQDFPEFID